MRNLHSRWPHIRITPRRCFAICALVLCSCVMLSLLPARSQSTNPQVSQGGSTTFDATSAQGMSTGSEIVDPQNTVVASFSGPYGGNANGWNVYVTCSNYNTPPNFTVSAPANAPIGVGYRVRTSPYYWTEGSALFDVVMGSGPTPTPTYPTPTPTYPTPTPTSTGTPQVDALIRVDGGANVGDDVYNLDGSGQSVAQTAVAGQAARYVVQLQNESAGSAQIRFTPSAAAVGWMARYFTGEGSGQSEITSYFNYYGYWDSPSLASGQSVEVRVEIEPAASLPGGSALELLLSAADASDGVVRDAVKATTTNSSSAPPPTPPPTPTPPIPAAQPDAQIRLPGESDYRGDDIYNVTGAQQTALQFTASGQSAVFEIKIENDGANPQDFIVKAPAISNGWSLQLFDAGTPESPTEGTEITAAATGQDGWTTPTLSPGAARLLRAELRRPAGNTSDSSALIQVQAGNKEDAVRLVSTGQSIDGIEYSLDFGESWQTVPAEGVSMSLFSVMGLRAIKGDANLDWPYIATEVKRYPRWHTQNVIHGIETIWVHCPTMDDIPVTVVCGNSLSTTLHITPVRK